MITLAIGLCSLLSKFIKGIKHKMPNERLDDKEQKNLKNTTKGKKHV